MKKFITTVLITVFVLSLTACGDETDNSNENDSDEPASTIVSISEETAINDFAEAQHMLSMVDGMLEADYSDVAVEEVDGYDREYYRVTEPGISTLQDLKELLYTRMDSNFVDSVIDNAQTLREFDGVLYMCPAGRGDDLTIASVEYSMLLNDDGVSGTLIAMIHRQDFSDETGDWYETGEVDEEYFDFDIVDGHAVFATMKYF